MSIVNIVKDKCMKVANTDETKAFFYKMIGDYYRYVAECAAEDKLEAVKNGALENYELAS
jgi:14-3-3 protein epsilon